MSINKIWEKRRTSIPLKPEPGFALTSFEHIRNTLLTNLKNRLPPVMHNALHDPSSVVRAFVDAIAETDLCLALQSDAFAEFVKKLEKT